MNELRIFNYESNQIRTVELNGELWWVAKDICDVFGETNRNRAMQALDDDEKGYTQIDTPGGMQKMAIVNEPGVYHLLFAMQPEKARGVSDEYIQKRMEQLKAFRRWITHQVLPSIRRTGTYSVDKPKVAPLQPESAGGVARLITVLRSTMKDNGQPPESISRMVKGLCDQLGIVLPADFVRVNPFEQLRLPMLDGNQSDA